MPKQTCPENTAQFSVGSSLKIHKVIEGFCHLCWPSDLAPGVVVRLLPSVDMKIRGNGRAFQRISAFIIFIPSHQHYSENPGNSVKGFFTVSSNTVAGGIDKLQ